MNPPRQSPNAREPATFLVPLLRTEEGSPDAAAVAAWHLALSNLVGVELPHDLLAMWLFPARGGVLVLAPEELGRDRIPLPAPSPFLHQHELFDLEERVRKAGYRSVVAVPVRGSSRDLGVALFAALDPGRYGVTQALRLHALARELVPTFEALANAPPVAATTLGRSAHCSADLPEMMARAAAEARSGPELLRLVSGVLQSALPHERLEVAVAGERPGRWALLSGAPARARWGDTGDHTSEAVEALLTRAEPDGILLVQDLKAAGVEWPVYGGGSRSERRVRALMGVELRMADAAPGWFLVGGPAPDSFRPADRDTLTRIGPVIALRVHGLRQSLAADVGQAHLHALQAAQPRVVKLVGLLAGVEHWGHAARQFEEEVREALGYSAVRFTLRLGEDRVVTVNPGELRPLGDLLAEPLELSPVAAVLRGNARFVVCGDQGDTLAVPLRIGGRPVGALELLGGDVGGGHPVTAAQQFADVIAPHLELLRRSALPGRETRLGERASRTGEAKTES